jgi:hypothetical protein
VTERTDGRFAARRRRVLAALGAATGVGVLSGVAGGQDGDGIVLRQGSRCVPVTPLSGDEAVEDLYDFRIRDQYAGRENGGSDPGEGPYFASIGTQSLQSPDSSILFLYDGPQGVSLVIVHGNLGDDSGGSVTFEFQGLPADGRFVVKDDYYVDRSSGTPAATNYDNWHVDSDPVTIDWTWGADRTDGAAFRALDGALPVTIAPGFNENATLHGEHYDGTTQRWELLTGSRPSPQRVALEMTQPISIERGSCDSGGKTGGGGGDGGGGGGSGTGTDGTQDDTPTEAGDEQDQRQQTEQQRKQLKHQKKQEKEAKKHRKKQRKHRRKHQRKQRKHERKQQKHGRTDDD